MNLNIHSINGVRVFESDDGIWYCLQDFLDLPRHQKVTMTADEMMARVSYHLKNNPAYDEVDYSIYETNSATNFAYFKSTLIPIPADTGAPKATYFVNAGLLYWVYAYWDTDLLWLSTNGFDRLREIDKFCDQVQRELESKRRPG